MSSHLDRLVLKGPHPDIRAVVLPPAFPDAPLSLYILGPIVPDLDLLRAMGVRVLKRQCIVGTVPEWRSARAMIKHLVMPFYVPAGDSFEPVDLDFGELPEQSPFGEPGSGWHFASPLMRPTYAVRRGPLMCGVDSALRHPYSYVVTAKLAPDRPYFVNLGARPGAPVEPFGDIDLGPLLKEIARAENQHPQGFLAPCN